MPKRNIPKREAKKSKKKNDNRGIEPLPALNSTEVEVVGKRRRRKEEE